ncbi:unnamed protein product [Rotaria sordida]|uniref:Uncharacterized protein n=1 Tax=Rotaria sordida TaxID=392033 RepID=A0A815NG94_9BILA|nr:unnamed protein product [Rotaria sordida]
MRIPKKVKIILSNARFGRLICQTNSYAALLRDKEKFQLRNELDNIKLDNQELEQQLNHVMKLLDHEYE